jgi:hypothetical protein
VEMRTFGVKRVLQINWRATRDKKKDLLADMRLGEDNLITAYAERQTANPAAHSAFLWHPIAPCAGRWSPHIVEARV